MSEDTDPLAYAICVADKDARRVCIEATVEMIAWMYMGLIANGIPEVAVLSLTTTWLKEVLGGFRK